MPKPNYQNTQSDDPALIRRDLFHLAQQLGVGAGGKLLGVVTIGTTETPIGHGQKVAPTGWRPYSLQWNPPVGLGIVGETRPPDAKNLYLVATVPTRCGIEVF